MKFNKMIKEMNNFFKEETGAQFPLASGNCAYFSIALSKYLCMYNIKHNIVVYTNKLYNFKPLSSKMDSLDLLKKSVSCVHMLVSITDDKYIDFSGIRNRHVIEKDMESFLPEDCRYLINVLNTNGHDNNLLRYSSLFTSNWLDISEFDNYIKNNWHG